jgi:acetylglutamate synthase
MAIDVCEYTVSASLHITAAVADAVNIGLQEFVCVHRVLTTSQCISCCMQRDEPVRGKKRISVSYDILTYL